MVHHERGPAPIPLTRAARLGALAACALAALGSSPALSAQDLTIDRLLASQCAQCHGTNGYAVGGMDSLAGDQDLLEDLLDMLGEDHIEDVMGHQAHGYRVDQIERIADYYWMLPEPASEDRQRVEED